MRRDGRLSKQNTLSGTFFAANFPGLDSFRRIFQPRVAVYLRRAIRTGTLLSQISTSLTDINQ